MVVNVTKTYLPPLDEYVRYLEGIWERGQVTNHGPLVTELEQRLRDRFDVKHVFLVSNGTIALQIAIKALELRGCVITTPFSYVATTSTIAWQGCQPVFADIDPQSLCIDPRAIEAAIRPEVTAIVATHVYGNPCDVERIGEIAAQNELKVIYDAAPAFDVCYKERSLVSFGDISTLSFHATKLFHTGEGGAVITNDDALAHRVGYLRNFGHDGPEAFFGIGINGKISELHAAMGLCVLPRLPELIARRREASELYDRLLSGLPLQRPIIRPGTNCNYTYYPVLFESEGALLRAKAQLNANSIFPRRYFFPALNTLPYCAGTRCPTAESVSRRVLCLPLYAGIDRAAVTSIAGSVRSTV